LETFFTNDPELAGRKIKEGGIVIFPTETVYGIGGSSLNSETCKQIYKIKNRPEDNPLIIHFSNLKNALEYAEIKNEYIESIIKLTPGPITFITRKKQEIFTSGLDTIAFRIPAFSLARKMLSISGPVSAPSANISGKPSITRFEDIKEIFGGKVEMVLYGEEPEIGIESTVVDLSLSSPVYLRPGFLSFEKIQEFFPDITMNKTLNVTPGMKYKHYSPNAEVKLYSNEKLENEENFAWIGFKNQPYSSYNCIVENNRKYAFHLYSFFIDCDRKKIKKIYCEAPKLDHLSNAIRNRIEKASENTK
jgi:L-threonylcarbamoyladenylate synthase